MTIYFCPGCATKYSTANLDDLSCDRKKYQGDKVAEHFLCRCGYEGKIWPDTPDGHALYLKHLYNEMTYLDDEIHSSRRSEQECLEFLKEKAILQQKAKAITGQTVENTKRTTTFVNAFGKWK